MYYDLAIVIPVRNRPIRMVELALESIKHQSEDYYVETIVVSNGSTKFKNEELELLQSYYDFELIKIDNCPVWNKPLTSNVGIKASSKDTPYIMTMDVDIILQPNFLKAVFNIEPLNKKILLCRSSDMQVPVPVSFTSLDKDYTNLLKQSKLRGTGTGGIQFAPRKFFYDVRGYDEDFVYWGAMDGDMVRRAKLYGLSPIWLNDVTSILHQPHKKKSKGLDKPEEQKAAQEAWERNHKLTVERIEVMVRNLNGWGEV